jgi:hypothetical protein
LLVFSFIVHGAGFFASSEYFRLSAADIAKVIIIALKIVMNVDFVKKFAKLKKQL